LSKHADILKKARAFVPEKKFRLILKFRLHFQSTIQTSDPFCPSGAAHGPGSNRFEDDFLGPDQIVDRPVSSDNSDDSGEDDDDGDVSDEESSSSSHASTIRSGVNVVKISSFFPTKPVKWRVP
jgi:hypothetical protein